MYQPKLLFPPAITLLLDHTPVRVQRVDARRARGIAERLIIIRIRERVSGFIT